GEVGQKVTLTILRPSTRDVKDYPLVRENISVASVKDAHILPQENGSPYKIGYVRITQFNVPTADELGARLDELE
ncbi:MAG: S41 family peptidase, partial [Verrucomicrobiota bacterium]